MLQCAQRHNFLVSGLNPPLTTEVGSSALYVAAATSDRYIFSSGSGASYILGNVAVAPATYLISDTMFYRYSAIATFIENAFRFNLNSIKYYLKTSMIHT